MTGTRRMEDLSIAYLSAIAAQASVDFEALHHDEDSVDCILKKVVALEGGSQFRSHSCSTEVNCFQKPIFGRGKHDYLPVKEKEL